MSMMAFEKFAQRMAAKSFFAELADARALGYDGVSAYYRAFRVMDETYAACFAADRPAVYLGARMITGRGKAA